MRLVLIAPITSQNAQDDAIVLRARNYDAITFADLGMPEYRHNANTTPSDQRVHHHLVLELMEKALCVIHHECSPEKQMELRNLCRFMRVPMVLMEDLPFSPPEMEEEIDAINISGRVDVPLGPRDRHAVSLDILTTAEHLNVLCDEMAELLKKEVLPPQLEVVHRATVDSVIADAKSAVREQVADATKAPTHLDELLAEDMPPYTGAHLASNVNSILRGWFDRVRHVFHRTRSRRMPRPYVLHTTLSTTG
ncbi:MAG TPA: hypothetical protein PLB89_05380 [Flavobacteriales bacterium]|nr:hypothetical protein [Flavobacteriales bacterium]